MISLQKKHSIPFWLFTLSIFFGLTLPYLIQDVMFQDAMLYSSVSHNMGIGFGTFWFPQYSTLNIAGLSSFHEHPPLVFAIQSIFFRIFGDSIYIERFYTLAMILLTITLINWLWRKVSENIPGAEYLGWLAVFYWTIVPIVFWTYRYNMMENTMAIFILLSVITSYYTLKWKGNRIGLWLLSGLFVFLASFSKGIPGLFPIVVPFLYWVATKRITLKQSLVYCVILTAVPVFIYGVLMLFPDSRTSLLTYFLKRVLWRIDLLPTTEYRIEIVWRLFMELLPGIIVTAFILILNKYKKLKSNQPENYKEAVFFFLTGLAGTLPLMLTFCQRGWYLVPAFPYFAIGFAILTAPIIAALTDKIGVNTLKFKTLVIAGSILLLSVLVYTGMQKGKIGRDEDVVTDLYSIGKIVPRFSTLTVPKEMYNQYDFVLQGFLVRNYNISISPYQEYDYFLKEKSSIHSIPENFVKIELGLIKYELFKKQNTINTH